MTSLVRILLTVYRPAVRRAALATLAGRRIDRKRPEAGRFLRPEVEQFVDDALARVPELLEEDEATRMPTLGNRHNVFLAALTVAAYHALLDRGLERRYAMELFADVGWKLYEQMIRAPQLLARVATHNPRRRVELALRGLMRFPFDAPGRPGYEVHSWADDEGMHTHWSYCAPLGFVQRHVERHGDRGELEAFYQSWCLYDWPAGDLLAGERAHSGVHYRRPHTLSRGDAVCDMCWSADDCTRAS